MSVSNGMVVQKKYSTQYFLQTHRIQQSSTSIRHPIFSNLAQQRHTLLLPPPLSLAAPCGVVFSCAISVLRWLLFFFASPFLAAFQNSYRMKMVAIRVTFLNDRHRLSNTMISPPPPRETKPRKLICNFLDFKTFFIHLHGVFFLLIC